MDNRLYQGDLVYDGSGDLKKITGLEEVLERAMRRFRLKRGSFACNPQLGSRLYTLDLYTASAETIRAMLEEALEGLEEVTVERVEKIEQTASLDLKLSVVLSVNGESAVLELLGG